MAPNNFNRMYEIAWLSPVICQVLDNSVSPWLDVEVGYSKDIMSKITLAKFTKKLYFDQHQYAEVFSYRADQVVKSEYQSSQRATLSRIRGVSNISKA
ncbi:hypothetical protein CHS0354_009197 [Potamilus streckersoni]|uniref:Uncharacterized protein n=1 Tax=Potamilus streckersoni TaxID=2493646 RepID=A0AAE0SZ41_9BIVA|nr:hypothetical protein CHS0354_009197 [Potamilus streckersoni]